MISVAQPRSSSRRTWKIAAIFTKKVDPQAYPRPQGPHAEGQGGHLLLAETPLIPEPAREIRFLVRSAIAAAPSRLEAPGPFSNRPRKRRLPRKVHGQVARAGSNFR